MASDWYEENIEESIRELVKLLRNQGINTTCSCEHEMYIEGDIPIDGDLKVIHDTLYNYYTEKNIKPNYIIHICVHVRDGHILQNSLRIVITDKIWNIE